MCRVAAFMTLATSTMYPLRQNWIKDRAEFQQITTPSPIAVTGIIG